ncbi:MAG: M48 family metallopeptidase [Anaerolineales bacterium]
MDFNDIEVIRSKRKTIAIIIQKDGTVQIRAPKYAAKIQIQQFFQSKLGWLQSHQSKILNQQTPVYKYEQGEQFLFLGTKYPLELSNRYKKPLVLNGNFQLNNRKEQDPEKIFTDWYRKKAREIFSERAEKFSKLHSYNYGKIRISSARTRWGSCSSKGTLSFTWRLVMAPMEIIDYVIIHELVHLKIKNHSSTFWNKVQELEPDYKRKRKWLKDNGHLLSLS